MHNNLDIKYIVAVKLLSYNENKEMIKQNNHIYQDDLPGP